MKLNVTIYQLINETILPSKKHVLNACEVRGWGCVKNLTTKNCQLTTKI